MAQWNWIGAIRVRDPDVLGAAAIAHESDVGAVRRIGRLAVKGHAAGDPGGVAARDRDRVQIPQQLKEDRLPIPGDVQGNPGPLVGRELYFAFGLEWQPFCHRRVLGGGGNHSS